ncbi:MAG: hypothetical protein VYE77_06625 [Planctomycetota bacterium]|nr:hypothetical protein [Planctomycetota bacterium]
MTRTTVLRLAGALLAAVVVIVGLEWWLRASDRPATTGSWVPDLADGRASLAMAKEATSRSPGLVPGTAAQDLDLLVSVDRVILCRHDNVPATAAPVLALLGDGRLAVWRSPPLPETPGRPRARLAALALPVAALADLTPGQRAVVLDGLGQMWVERPVDPSRLILRGVAGSRADVARLVGWLR